MFARFKGALVIDDMIAQVGDMLVGEDIVVCTLTFHDAIELFDIGDTGYTQSLHLYVGSALSSA